MSEFEYLESQGYERLRRLEDGRIIGIMPMLFTVGLFVGLTEESYDRRYCYETRKEAIDALNSWDGNGDAPGNWKAVK